MPNPHNYVINNCMFILLDVYNILTLNGRKRELTVVRRPAVSEAFLWPQITI